MHSFKSSFINLYDTSGWSNPFTEIKDKDSGTKLKISKEIGCLLHSSQVPGKKYVDMQTGGESSRILALLSHQWKLPTLLRVLPKNDPLRGGLYLGFHGWFAVLMWCFLPGAVKKHQKGQWRLTVQWIFSQSSKVIQQEKITFSKTVLEQIDK